MSGFCSGLALRALRRLRGNCAGFATCVAHEKRVARLGVLRAAQSGIALITALVIVLAISLVAIGIARIVFDAERGARAERDRTLAFQAAEAGLADAERDIEGGIDPASARAAMFHDDGAIGFVPGCGSVAPNLGLCAYEAGAIPAWQIVDAAATTPYGSFTGAVMPVLPYGGPLPLAPPRYVIELLPAVQAGEDAGLGAQRLFRITAFGYGARADTLVVLQSVYRRGQATETQP